MKRLKREKHNTVWTNLHSWCAQYRKTHRLTVRQFLRGIGLDDVYNLSRYLSPHYANGNVPLSSKQFTTYPLYRKLKELYRNPTILDNINFDPPSLVDIADELRYSGWTDSRICHWNVKNINGILHIDVGANECGSNNITKEEALELFQTGIGIKNIVIDEITYWILL